MVRSLQFNFSSIPHYSGRQDSSQEEIIKAWHDFFYDGRSDSVINNAEHDVRFPALQFLVLNFERLNLGTEALTTAPLIRKFRNG
ncbi:MAG: hypothetical protein HETSPECPRED_007922 [Heterodermia speciosa]|uniref:Uncharacterized protein n=1 Tax=Heterodermia speciosa TaxID=116794 RepID=A0A8H3EMB7_9LECA|nr:MAG: hypothetical protein HETSPECPRED_007922 [Heterodermia speciosa]